MVYILYFLNKKKIYVVYNITIITLNRSIILSYKKKLSKFIIARTQYNNGQYYGSSNA